MKHKWWGGNLWELKIDYGLSDGMYIINFDLVFDQLIIVQYFIKNNIIGGFSVE